MKAANYPRERRVIGEHRRAVLFPFRPSRLNSGQRQEGLLFPRLIEGRCVAVRWRTVEIGRTRLESHVSSDRGTPNERLSFVSQVCIIRRPRCSPLITAFRASSVTGSAPSRPPPGISGRLLGFPVPRQVPVECVGLIVRH